MANKDIYFLLIQIDEAHTAAWPQGIIKLGTPHTDIEDRLSKAREFNADKIVGNETFFKVVVDPWNNAFAERYHAWPDKYYLFDADRKIIAKSTYGAHKDAVIDEDCVDLIYRL